MNERKTGLDWLKLSTIVIFCSLLFILFPDAAFADYGIPTIDIHLNGTTLDVIHSNGKDEKYPGNDITIKDASGNILLEQSSVEIKGRGNTTWDQVKKPYQIKFEKKQDLFALGKSKKWVLLANYMDPSFLRNDLALEIARGAGIEGTTDGQSVWLSIDGQDLGLYYLCHKPSTGSDSLNLGDGLGVLFELDQPYRDEEIDFFSKAGDHFALKDSVSEKSDEIALACTIFISKWDRAQAAAVARDWEGLNQLMDVESFARYYLINELCVNLDATMTSFFIYMDGAKDKLHAGPAWDYDLSFGNRWKLASARMWCYKSLMEDVDPNCQILHELMDIPEFRQLVCEIWNKQMKPVAAECISHLPASADEIRRAAFKDNEIWNGADFDFAVSSLTEWVSARADYLDNWFLECPEFEEGSYRLSINGRNVSVEGLARDDSRLLITRLPDGFYLLGNVEGTAFLTGGAAKDMLTGVTLTSARTYANAQEWMPQVVDNGVRFFNKESGLYLQVVGNQLMEGKLDAAASVFSYVSAADVDERIEAYLTRLYTFLLDRKIDQIGLYGWARYLSEGLPASKIVEGITRSREFLAKTISDEDYVRMLYQALLGREAADEEVEIWTGVLTLGYTRKKLIEGVANSMEYANLCDEYGIVAGHYKSDDILDNYSDYRNDVMRLYEILLGRKADEPGLRGWVSCMVDGLTRQNIILSFADSSEFKARGLSGHDVVTALFNACVGRDPITVEINKYTAFLQKNGMTATIKRIMAESI